MPDMFKKCKTSNTPNLLITATVFKITRIPLDCGKACIREGYIRSFLNF
jgi:hypothetical protein